MRYAMLRSAMLCYAMLCYAMLRSAMLRISPMCARFGVRGSLQRTRGSLRIGRACNEARFASIPSSRA